MLIIRVYEAPTDTRPDPSNDKLIGKVEIAVASFGKSSTDQTWTGSKTGVFDLEDDRGAHILKAGTRQKAAVEVKLQFMEAALKRSQILEGQLETVKQLQIITSERLEARDKEIEGLRTDLDRKNQDLDHVVAERNKMRDELQRIRMNSGIGGMTGLSNMPVVQLVAAQQKPKAEAGTQDGASKDDSKDLTQAYASAMQQVGDMNAFLIQTLDDLSKRESELKVLQEEVARYKEDFGVLRMQQVLLCKEHVQKVGELEKERAQLLKQHADEKLRADVESNKAAASLQKLDEIAKLTPEGMQQNLADAERNLILMQADNDVYERIVRIKKEEEQQLRTRYDSLVIDMARQEHRLRERIGRLDRGRRAAENRLADCQRVLMTSVPGEQLSKVRQEYILLKEKYGSVMNEESRAVLDRATVEAHKQRSSKLSKENEDLRLQLAEVSDKANSLSARLDALSGKENSSEQQQQLAALAAKLVKLEVSERNASRRAELALERMRNAEADMQRMQGRINSLEEESVEIVARKHELEESERELRARLEGCVAANVAEKMRDQISKQESTITELQISATQHQEIANLATDQAKAMEDLYSVHKEELESLRAFLSQVQSESDDQAELGLLHGKLLDRERQIHELTSKLAGMDRELVRMDEYVVRLEDTLEQKSQLLFDSNESHSEKIKRLERTVDELRAKVAGQIPLEKADQWAASLRDLTEQKLAAAEDLSAARKKMQEAEERAEILEIRYKDQVDNVRILREDLGAQRSGLETIVDKISAQIGDVTKLKVENLRYGRKVKQLQEREVFLESHGNQLEKEIRKLEEQLIQTMSESEAKAQNSVEVQSLRQRVQELESQLATASMSFKAPVRSSGELKKTAAAPPVFTQIFAQVEAKSMDYQAISALKVVLITCVCVCVYVRARMYEGVMCYLPKLRQSVWIIRPYLPSR